ncbi:MAG: polysaccharide deacetylase family protein [Candidatus Promineifilaceae bacterium]
MLNERILLLIGKQRALPALVTLLFAMLLLAACSPSTAAVAVAMPTRPLSPAAPTVETTATAVLEPPPSPTWTWTPTTIPSLTPPPTASATFPPTATATVTATTQPTVTSAPATATKLPPLPTPSGVYSWTLKVPILMYHYISEPPEDADKYRVDLSVTPQDFEAQMAYLDENGFEAVDLYDLSLAIAAKRDLPEKPVIITLDDGYLDNYTSAFPILRKYGMEATFFVVTQFIDDGREGYLTWDMVEEMAAAGMRFEPHSKTHPDLSIAERDFAIYEILGSQETIAAHTGDMPRYFCYPGGDYSDETIEILKELDFWGALTTAGGEWHGFKDRFEWTRLRMRNTTALSEFADLVDPGATVSGKPPE